MARHSEIVVCGINVTASPHPAGTYLSLIKAAANQEVLLAGSDWAKITTPEEYEQDKTVVHGRICVWSQIEKDGEWFNKEKNTFATKEDKKEINIPEKLAPNFRYFYYAFDLSRHILIFEARNELRQSFNAKRAGRFFSDLFNNLGSEYPDVDVTVIPEEGSVERILRMHKLRKLKIVVTRPNGEDLSDEYNEVMNEMNSQNAKTIIHELSKAPKVDSLLPNAKTETLARIAALNGHVEGQGAEGGDSTKEHPKAHTVSVPKDGSQFYRFISSLIKF